MLKKSVSLLLMGSLPCFLTANAFAHTTLNPATTTVGAPTATTPEMTLLQSVLELQGENLTTEQMQTQFQAATSHYMSMAQTESANEQTERLQQAMVTLGLYTPTQATAFMNDAQVAARQLAVSDLRTQQELSQGLSVEITALANLHAPMGAQFSLCQAMVPVFLGGAIAGAFVIDGAIDPSPRATLGESLFVGALIAGVIGYVSQETVGC